MAADVPVLGMGFKVEFEFGDVEFELAALTCESVLVRVVLGLTLPMQLDGAAVCETEQGLHFKGVELVLAVLTV